MLNGIIGAITICYPFLVWYSLEYFQPRSVALMLAVLFLLRLLLLMRRNPRSVPAGRTWLSVLPVCVLFLLLTALINETRWLMLYPAFISLLFFAVFALSLVYPPTVVERLARLEDPDLPPKGVVYTRKVTQVWSVFFVANAAISLATVWYGEHWLWSLYNGGVFYVLMGTLMAVEMLIRRKVKASF